MRTRRSRVAAIAGVVALTASMLVVGATVSTAGLCGEFRWPIKSLADANARDINFEPQRVRLARLYQLDRPGRVTDDTPRIRPEEFQVYEFVAQVERAVIEGDHDLKFVISVPRHPEQTMAMEFLAGVCMESRFRRDRMLAARQKALDLCGPLSQEYTELQGRVVIKGVGFWGNLQHEEIGGAPNHFQLIPGLGIRGTCEHVDA
jgi:hypothetical protein